MPFSPLVGAGGAREKHDGGGFRQFRRFRAISTALPFANPVLSEDQLGVGVALSLQEDLERVGGGRRLELRLEEEGVREMSSSSSPSEEVDLDGSGGAEGVDRGGSGGVDCGCRDGRGGAGDVD